MTRTPPIGTIPTPYAMHAAIRQTQAARPGTAKETMMKRALALATDLAAERDRLAAKLDTQWSWLMEISSDDRVNEPSPEFTQRESIFFKTLDRYEDCCDALIATKTVVLS